MQPPRRRHRLCIEVDADTVADLRSAFSATRLPPNPDEDFYLSAGSSTSSYSVTYTVDESMTPARYREEAAAWAASKRQDPHPDPLSGLPPMTLRRTPKEDA